MWHHRVHLTIKCDTTDYINNKMWHHRVHLTIKCDTTEYI